MEVEVEVMLKVGVRATLEEDLGVEVRLELERVDLIFESTRSEVTGFNLGPASGTGTDVEMTGLMLSLTCSRSRSSSESATAWKVLELVLGKRGIIEGLRVNLRLRRGVVNWILEFGFGLKGWDRG